MVGKVEAVSNSAKNQSEMKGPVGVTVDSSEQLHHAIAVTAYHLAERRKFEPGHELEDWLNAEAQVLAEMESLKGFPA